MPCLCVWGDCFPLVCICLTRLRPKIDKARTWFDRAVRLDPDLGDAWAYFYKFEVANGSSERVQRVLRRCTEADPRHGDVWTMTRKRECKALHYTMEQQLKATAAALP